MVIYIYLLEAHNVNLIRGNMKAYRIQLAGYLKRLSKGDSLKDKNIEKSKEIQKIEKNFCSNCGIEDIQEDSNFCVNCGNRLTKIEKIIKKDSVVENKFNNKSPVLALVLSFFVPGLGHIYIHKFKKGISYLIIITGLFVLPNIILFNDTNYIIMIIANSIFIIDFMIYIYNLIDVYKIAKMMRNGENKINTLSRKNDTQIYRN